MSLPKICKAGATDCQIIDYAVQFEEMEESTLASAAELRKSIWGGKKPPEAMLEAEVAFKRRLEALLEETKEAFAVQSAAMLAELENTSSQRLLEQQRIAYEKSFQLGSRKGYKEGKAAAGEELQHLLTAFAEMISQIADKKEQVVMEQQQALRKLVLTIAEKVINVSLATSGEIVERMVVKALEGQRQIPWVKLHIAQCDAILMENSGCNMQQTLEHIAGYVRLDVMKNAKSGTCIVELPDLIIDASVENQLATIASSMEEAKNS